MLIKTNNNEIAYLNEAGIALTTTNKKIEGAENFERFFYTTNIIEVFSILNYHLINKNKLSFEFNVARKKDVAREKLDILAKETDKLVDLYSNIIKNHFEFIGNIETSLVKKTMIVNFHFNIEDLKQKDLMLFANDIIFLKHLIETCTNQINEYINDDEKVFKSANQKQPGKTVKINLNTLDIEKDVVIKVLEDIVYLLKNEDCSQIVLNLKD